MELRKDSEWIRIHWASQREAALLVRSMEEALLGGQQTKKLCSPMQKQRCQRGGTAPPSMRELHSARIRQQRVQPPYAISSSLHRP